jgi:hypothetical protein
MIRGVCDWACPHHGQDVPTGDVLFKPLIFRDNVSQTIAYPHRFACFWCGYLLSPNSNVAANTDGDEISLSTFQGSWPIEHTGGYELLWLQLNLRFSLDFPCSRYTMAIR